MINRRRTGNRVIISSPNSDGQNVEVSLDGRLKSDNRDIIKNLTNSAIEVGTNAVEVKVEETANELRKGVIITPDKKIYWGDQNVTISNGSPIFKNQSIFIAASSEAKIYLISEFSNVDVRIVEVLDE